MDNRPPEDLLESTHHFPGVYRIKTIGTPFTANGYDVGADQVRNMTLEPATPEEIAQTVAVMGGADWSRWRMGSKARCRT